MDLYTSVSFELSQRLTERYSTSFSLSSRLFPRDIRQAIYSIYGLVRLADEIVDTFTTANRQDMLAAFETETKTALQASVSTNPLLHAFAVTASTYAIGWDLLQPFFDSMRMDLREVSYTDTLYRQYIYGSAEVVGLMCLRVFVGGDDARYTKLQSSAQALGAAYQKVNFLRDIRDDFTQRGRMYFPRVSFETFSETDKQTIVADIEQDFTRASEAFEQLPTNVRPAVVTSYNYYRKLLTKLADTPVDVLKTTRVRLPNTYKAWLYIQARVGRGIS